MWEPVHGLCVERLQIKIAPQSFQRWFSTPLKYRWPQLKIRCQGWSWNGNPSRVPQLRLLLEKEELVSFPDQAARCTERFFSDKFLIFLSFFPSAAFKKRLHVSKALYSLFPPPLKAKSRRQEIGVAPKWNKTRSECPPQLFIVSLLLHSA